MLEHFIIKHIFNLTLSLLLSAGECVYSVMPVMDPKDS